MDNALLPVGEVTLTTVPGFSYGRLEEHLQRHLQRPLSQHWCAMGCAARTMFGRNSKRSREAIRERIWKLFHRMLDHGMFLTIEYAPRSGGSHGEIIAMKIYTVAEGREQQAAEAQVKRMWQRRQLTTGAVERACQILQLPAPVLELDAWIDPDEPVE
jgi:hypothetical protein